MRPVDADYLLKASRRGKVLYFDDTTTDGYTDVLLAVEVERAPAIEAEPVRHGEWTEKKSGNGVFDYYFICSECHKNTPDKAFLIAPDFCPNCGAKMDGGANIP